MICPNCDEEIELTWRRYAKAPFGKHKCPSCSSRFKLKRPWYYWLIPVSVWPLTFLVGVKIILFMHGNCELEKYIGPVVTALIITVAAVLLIIDRKIENNMGTKVAKTI